MNTNFLNIVRRIVAEQGEGILADPQRLKSIVRDYAKDEPKDERLAFGRCIEAGCYGELKRAATPEERSRLKPALSRRVANATGLDPALCAAALDILEAAISPAPQRGVPSSAQTIPAQGFMPKTGILGGIRGISKKTVVFACAGGIGGFAGELLSEVFRMNDGSGTFWGNAFSTARWAAFIGLGISVALLIAQHVYLKKTPFIAQIIKTAVLGIVIGSLAGGVAQIIFAFTNVISTLAEVISRVLCWGILGWGTGWGVSFFVPNFPKKRAMLAGFLGGAMGGLLFRIIIIGLSDVLGRIVGITILGFFIGLAISYIEEALREAWLTIIWGPKETTTVALGAKPVSFGSSREADIYLPTKRGEQPAPPIRAIVKIENGKIVIEDRLANQCGELHGGAQLDLGRVSIVVHTKQLG